MLASCIKLRILSNHILSPVIDELTSIIEASNVPQSASIETADECSEAFNDLIEQSQQTFKKTTPVQIVEAIRLVCKTNFHHSK